MQIGERIKALRTGLGLTVGSLSERTGLSKGLISQVENDKTSPSLATLEKLSEGLGVPVAYLLLRPDQGVSVTRAGQRPLHRFGPDQIKVEVLSGCPSRSLKAVLVEMPPGSSTGRGVHAHKGEEFHLILEGRVTATQGGESVVLNAGDTFHWSGCIAHRVENVGNGLARILAVTSSGIMDAVGEESEIQ